jgi:lipopolysaccharide biosynthesis glycosyltransferase
MENHDEVKQSLKFFQQSEASKDPNPDDDPDDDDNENEYDEEEEDSSIWSRIFEKPMKQPADLSKISKYGNTFRNPLTLTNHDSRIEDLETYWEEVAVSMEEHALVKDHDLLFALARNKVLKIPSRYQLNNTAISVVLRVTIGKESDSNAHTTAKPHKKDGLNALRALIEFADPDSWNAKMTSVNQLLSLKFQEHEDVDQYLVKASSLFAKCASKTIVLPDLYNGQLIKSFDGVKAYKDALTQMQTSASEINEESIRKTVILVRDTLNRE